MSQTIQPQPARRKSIHPSCESRVAALPRSRARQRILATLLSVSLLTACAPPRDGRGPSAVEAMGIGVGFLVLTPVFIAASLVEGLSALPYLESADLHEVDRKMSASGAPVNINRTYQYAYQKRLESVPASGDTGQVFYNMQDATQHFRKVLRGYGVDNAHNYLLTAIRTADYDGYTLYAVVYRPAGVLRVPSRYGPRVIHEGQQGYYRPWRINSAGGKQDTVIDWAGVPRKSIGSQKGQAILMTLAANSVLLDRRSPDYWSTETRWKQGQHRSIVARRQAGLEQQLGHRHGSTPKRPAF